MGHPALCDEDILLWSEQQAEIVRNLARTRRDLPNDFDAENVAEEIESVGRSELAAVEGQLQNILVHLMKIAAAPDAEAARHWRVEIAAFHGEVRRRYSPSMRQRIDFDQLWELARELSVLAADPSEEVEGILPMQAPMGIEKLVAEKIDSLGLGEVIRTRRS